MPPEKKPVFLLLLLVLLLTLPVPVFASLIAPATTTSPALNLAPVRTVAVVPVATTVTSAAPQTGAISISSAPSGASVVIDGTAMGTTPFTIRTLTAGSHSLVLQMNGYLDYTTSFTIQADQLNQQSYTLVPVPATTSQQTPVQTTVLSTVAATTVATRATTAQPAVTQVIPTPTPTHAPQAPARSLAEQLQALGPVTIQPVTIRVGNHSKTPLLTTLSPYFSYQFNTQNVTSSLGYQTPTVTTFPLSYIEVDTMNTPLSSTRPVSSQDTAYWAIWADDCTVFIKITDTVYNDPNFRWISLDPTATAFYQVSRFPFSDNATRWQNQYVPGLVASGPVKDVYVDSEGFHYFALNFAPIANHNPSDPPIYTGLVHLDQTVSGQGKPMGLLKIPLTGSGIWYKKASVGPLTIPVPDSFVQVPAGELTEQDVGNPNDNMILSEASSSSLQGASAFAILFADMDHTYYVRIIPISKNGNAGVPTMPVTVTVKRPVPCPATGTGNVQSDVLVRPPSATISAFYMTLFVPDWIRTYQDGSLEARAHFVTVATPPFCSAPVTGNQAIDMLNAQSCSMFGGSQPGYHFYADPAESHWYDTVWDIITALFQAFKTVANAVSAAYNSINNFVVQIAAYAVQGLTFGAFDCNSSPACTGVLHAGLAIAESALGVPPTLPNAADLENMGADYMAKMAADEIGAGGVLDAAQSAYSNMPDSAKDTIKSNAGDIGRQMGEAVGAQSAAAVYGAAGNFYIPDPLYYQAHPATVMVRVTNPNTIATDPVTLYVKDTGGFYHPASAMVPSLKPSDSTVIPIILNEDFSKGYTTGCTGTSYTSTNGVPCYWDNWQQAARDYGPDQFVITYSVKKNGQWISDLTPSSSGTLLSNQNVINIDENGNTCPPYTSTQVLKYPDGWQVQENGLSQELENVMWNVYSFTEGDHGRLIG
ncbi:MAG: PEGA domain-containing protein [Methanoregula sp.]|jgi:hypothetical protein|uniref:PEGA domain-containing protein n=1 Tax=Methanoregula sp. TaxID=2052170 RepID=UPI003C2835BE